MKAGTGRVWSIHTEPPLPSSYSSFTILILDSCDTLNLLLNNTHTLHLCLIIINFYEPHTVEILSLSTLFLKFVDCEKMILRWWYSLTRISKTKGQCPFYNIYGRLQRLNAETDTCFIPCHPRCQMFFPFQHLQHSKNWTICPSQEIFLLVSVKLAWTELQNVILFKQSKSFKPNFTPSNVADF